MTLPEPWHVAQPRSMVKKPCEARTRPDPWQVGQVMGLLPASAPEPWQESQATDVVTLMVSCLPLYASSSDTARL